MDKDIIQQGEDNPEFPDVNASLSSIQFLSKFDWILLVEGNSDIDFYNRFLSTFKRFNNKKKFDKELKMSLGAFPRQMKKTCRQKIIRLIEQKEDKHFFGIMDFDYGKPAYKIDIEEKIIFAKPNSLETMLVQNANIKKFSTLIQSYESIDKNISKKIITSSILFAFKIGIIRSYAYHTKNSGFCFSFTKDYSTFVEIEKDDDNIVNFHFNLDMYIDELLKYYDNKKIDISKEILLEEINNKKENLLIDNWINWDIYTFCQGHDIIHFIEALCKLMGVLPLKLEETIINNYDKNWFSKSRIYKWLKKLEESKNIEEKSLTNPKYRDYIISVG